MSIRSAIAALSDGRPVLRNDRYFNPAELNGANGASWVVEPGPGSFSLLLPLLLSLRGVTRPESVRQQFVFEGGLRLSDGTRVNICVSRWVEQVPNPAPFLQGLAPPIALRSHVAVEQIDYGDNWQASAALSGEELEVIASFVRPAVNQLLAADIVFLQKQGIAGRPVPTTGELLENWRKPRAEFAELHEHLDKFRRGSLVERLNNPELDRYSFIKEDWTTFALVEGEPDVRVAMPSVNRDEPSYRIGGVQIAEVRCSIDIYDLGTRSLDQPVRDRSGQMVTTVHSLAMVDPFSLRLQPRAKPPAGLTPADATRVVRHMRNAYLRFVNDKSKRLVSSHHNRVDIVIL